MYINSLQKGQSLIEILFAITLFTIGVVTVGYVLFDAFDSLRYGSEATSARLFAQEGIEAVRAIRDTSADALLEGVFGVSYDSGVWSTKESPDTHGRFNRSITIEEGEGETWKVTSMVTWDDPSGLSKEYALSTVLSNWQQDRGSARLLGVDVGSVTLNASSTEIDGITLYNAGSGDSVTLDALALLYEGDGMLEEVYIEDIQLHGTSSTPVVSGEYIDIPDHTIAYASGAHSVGPLKVSAPMEEAQGFILSLRFSDGSHRHIRLQP